jgi:hypothetical protein
MNFHPAISNALAADRQRELRAAGRTARSRGPDKPREARRSRVHLTLRRRPRAQHAC